jgi:hypothetical protein
MTPTPPSPEDGSSLPPRHRPNLGNLAKDTTETDLWAFDDTDLPEMEAPAPARPTELKVPPPRETAKKNARRKGGRAEDQEEVPPAKAPGGKDSVRVNVSKNRGKNPVGGGSSALGKADREFEDLDRWDEPGNAPVADAISPVSEPEPELVVIPEMEAEAPAPAEPAAGERDEFEPVVRENATPVSLRPHLGLSKIERIGLVALVAVLVIGGGLIYFATISRLPQGADLVREQDFPIEGKHVTIASAESYWRAPVSEGAEADTFRPGTLLLPVVRLTIEGGPAAVRVFFRKGDGTLVGDTVTRAVRPGETLQIAATGGFEEAGAYAAYRTGQSKPWTIEVREAPSADTEASRFGKLFETTISSDRR